MMHFKTALALVAIFAFSTAMPHLAQLKEVWWRSTTWTVDDMYRMSSYRIGLKTDDESAERDAESITTDGMTEEEAKVAENEEKFESQAEVSGWWILTLTLV